jgi:hypothetical protein
MKGASIGNRRIVIERAHDIWCPAALAVEKLAVCARGFTAGSPLHWDVNNVIPEP